MRTTLLTGMLFFFSSQAVADSYVYVSVSGENIISQFKMDADTGELKHQKDFAAHRSPGPLAVDPQKRYLFASLRGSGKFVSYRIEAKTGRLKPLSSVPSNGSAAYVLTDRTGRYLFSAFYGEGKIAVHAIGADGSLGTAALQTIPTEQKAHCIVIDSGNRFVYVPHTGPNAIYQFRFDSKTGRLSPNHVSKVTTPEGTEPRHLWFHPSRPFAYVDNEKESSVTVFKRDALTGTLSPLQTL